MDLPSTALCTVTLSVGPPSNYACVMCCLSQEGALLSEFAPCSLVLEHVKLSAHRSRWPICPVFPVMFHTLLSTCLPLQLHFSLCSSRTSLCRGPTFNSLSASSHYLWRFLVFCISVSLYSLLPRLVCLKESVHPNYSERVFLLSLVVSSHADNFSFTLSCL